MKKQHVSIGFVSAILFLSMASAPARADSLQELLSATSDAFQGTLDWQISVDDNFVAQEFSATASGQTKTFDLSQLPNGIVLFTDDGHDVVSVKSTDFDPSHGGDLTVTYLQNGITNDYQTMDVEVERNGNQWQMLVNDQSGHHVVTEAYFKANKVFGQVVGIDSITFQ